MEIQVSEKGLAGGLDVSQAASINGLAESAGYTAPIVGVDDFRAAPAPTRQRAEKTPRVEASSRVTYFVSTNAVPDYPIKIGLSTRNGLGLRMYNLQNACPYPLIVLKAVKATTWGEKALHRMFEEDRMEREWFARSPRLMALIERAKADECMDRLGFEWLAPTPDHDARMRRAVNARPPRTAALSPAPEDKAK